jgi:glycosyltransferase involved in cell wall biosynthesis
MGVRRKIRVLELRSVLGTGGGPEKTILLGAARANRDDFDIVVCYIRDRRDGVFHLDARAQALGVDYVEVDERHSFDVRIWGQLTRLVRGRHIDIVHAHEHKTDLLVLLLARRTGVIPLATAHGWTGQSVRERRVYYPADKRLLARYPRVIAVSSEIKDTLVRAGARADRVTVILNAIDPAAFRRSAERRDAVRRELGFGPGDTVIGAVGRLERQKRFDVLLEAMAPIAAARSGIRLVIVGDGRLRAGLERQASDLGLNGTCRFLGHRQDIADLHNAFDLFVQSSEYEGTPNAVLEAMAMETPIVATDVGGTRELAEPDVHALIVPRPETPLLAASIVRALADAEGRLSRAAAARRRVETELSFETRTRRLEALYQDLVARHSGQGCI